MPKCEINVFDVPIIMRGRETFIHTYECGSSSNEKILLLHGYSGSSLHYYKMIPVLAEKFHVYSIDLVGMGLSGRDSFGFSRILEE